MFINSPYDFMPGTMLSAIQRVGITSGLKLCLDAGDINSYDGTSQTWTDVSGNGYNFYRGSGSGADSGDPIFNGSAGRQSSSEYFSFDGTDDRFTSNQANPAWVENLHKSGARWAFATWLYVSGSLPATAAVLFGDNAATNAKIGVSAFIRSTGALRLTVTNGSISTLLLTSTATVNTSAWNYLACEVDASGNGSMTINATQEDASTVYTSPSASSATHQLEIAHDGVGSVGTGYIPSGYRLPNIQLWESAVPTKAQLLSLRSLTATKFA